MVLYAGVEASLIPPVRDIPVSVSVIFEDSNAKPVHFGIEPAGTTGAPSLVFNLVSSPSIFSTLIVADETVVPPESLRFI